jgi:hypothetical protein
MRLRHQLRSRLAGAAGFACILAGIWVDWRWLPTAVLPLTIWAFYATLKAKFQQEITRRAKERADGRLVYGVVTDAGGGHIDVRVSRDTPTYPRVGVDVTMRFPQWPPPRR